MSAPETQTFTENPLLSVVPGPVVVPHAFREPHTRDFAASYVEEAFFLTLERVEDKMKRLLRAPQCDAIIMNGEAMLALWGALKSVIVQGDRVLAIATGIFGCGIAEMAKDIGAHVKTVTFAFEESALDVERIQKAAQEFQPKLITMVHCETPSGLLNPVEPIGKVAREVGALLYVDFVSSGCGVALEVDAWGIDLGLLGSQKVLSLPPDLCVITVSSRAWDIIGQVNYKGYDALQDWKDHIVKRSIPYTHNWHAIAALETAADFFLAEGATNTWIRHEDVAQMCRERLTAMGVKVFGRPDHSIPSPTVTAAYIPPGWDWPRLDATLRTKGVIVSGSFGSLAGKIFRIGHMGSQADKERIGKVLDVLEEIFTH